ncbi:MAG TPA: type II secretion system protein M [Candidatus Competibacter phosphatis]|jgi:general secretion pathway protein M|nr:type II secretion system protein M [Gammaproteobacteria bacterium]MDG4562763.1 type II secretion system protein M [Candidatus Competibacter sp.]HMQ12198.1 type II secretion system protein M [Candidatus Competibacter phosphatis]HMR02248.1 type II secretion system protein M [Candidatus Competibacter phosphatis]
MKAWWETLSARERLLVIGGLGLTLALLGYALVWEPFRTSHRQLQQRVAEQRADLIWMRQAAREVKRLSGNAGTSPTRDGRSLLTLVDQTARAAGLASALKRVAPQGEDKLSAQLDGVEFDKLIPWLGMLEHDHRIAIVNLSIDRANATGLVNARVILRETRP